MGPEVCGEDGVTYVNECVAFCQEIAIVKETPCHLEPEASFRVSKATFGPQFDESSLVSKQEMQKFVGEKFHFVGKIDITKGFSSSELNFSRYDNIIVNTTGVENVVDEADEDEEEDDNESFSLEQMRLTNDGKLYTSKTDLDVAELPDLSALQPQRPKVASRRRHLRRNLVVVGDDTRSQVVNTMEFPYSAVSEVDFHGRSEGGCTATLISRSTALTAGHCVYDAEKKHWLPFRQIAPGRYREGSTTMEPFGTWDIDYATTFRGYTSRNLKRYDIAVLHLAPRTDDHGNLEYAGDVAGFVGIEKRSVFSRSLNDVMIVGYPADKPHGEQWKAKSCGK